MNIVAEATNKVTRLADKFEKKPKLNPLVSHAASMILRAAAARTVLAQEHDITDSKLFDIISNPSKAFQTFRAAARSHVPNVKKLQVVGKVYCGDSVADGMFDSLNSLKAPTMDQYDKLPSYIEAVSTYDQIMKLASIGDKIPTISAVKGEKLLRGLKSTVTDFFSITSLHFLHLGQAGVGHFVFLLNAIISNINNAASAEELITQHYLG